MSGNKIRILIYTAAFALLLILSAVLISLVVGVWKGTGSSSEPAPVLSGTGGEMAPSAFQSSPDSLTAGAGSVEEGEGIHFLLIPGTTYVNRGKSLELYLDVVPVSENRIYLCGEGYHLGNHMPSMDIKEYADLEPEEGENEIYRNEDGTLELQIQEGRKTISLRDQRDDPIMPFDGELKVITEADLAKMNGEEPEIPEDDGTISLEDIIASEFAEEAPEPDPDTLVLTWGDGGKGFTEFAGEEANEYKKVRLTAMILEPELDHMAMKFSTLDGQEFYAFGDPYPYDTEETNTVVLDLIYRGKNPQFNKKDFGGTEEYCFNLEEIRQLTEEEYEELKERLPE